MNSDTTAGKAEGGAWICAKCGRAPQSHGNPACQCAYEPTWQVVPVTGPAVPPGGEELREVIMRWLYRNTGYDEKYLPEFADDLLALRPVRDALAAQEKVRRMEALAEELEGHGRALVERPDQMPAFHGRQVLVIATALRRTLDGEPT